MAEWWDVLDEHGNKTGRLHERGKPMAEGDYHQVVHVWILNPRGEFLVSKRTGGVPSCADMWQTTGGCAVTGDDGLAAALRETREELGLALCPDDGRLFKRYAAPHREDKGSYLCDVWLFRQDIDLAAVVFQPEETCAAMWAGQDTIRQMIREGIFIRDWYPYLDALFDYCGGSV